MLKIKNIKKKLSLLLSVVLFFQIAPIPMVYANEKPLINNLNLINDSWDNIEYTYEENGKTYRVHEKITQNKNLINVDTQIYEQFNGEYIFFEKYNTEIISLKDQIEVTQIKDNKIESKIIKLNNTSKLHTNKLRSTGWEFVDSFDGSTHFENFTYGVVTGIITSIVTGGFGTVASSVISTIVGGIVSNEVPVLYYKRMVFYYREGPALVTQVQVSTTFYYDSNHDHYYDATTVTYKGMFPW